MYIFEIRINLHTNKNRKLTVNHSKMKQFNKIWFVWLLLVCLWNFGWPEVEPIYDVLVAILLSILFILSGQNRKIQLFFVIIFHCTLISRAR